MRILVIGALLAWATAAAAGEWKLPGDRETLSRDAIAEVLKGNDYPATGAFTKRVEVK